MLSAESSPKCPASLASVNIYQDVTTECLDASGSTLILRPFASPNKVLESLIQKGNIDYLLVSLLLHIEWYQFVIEKMFPYNNFTRPFEILFLS